jgi:hypothetical protein
MNPKTHQSKTASFKKDGPPAALNLLDIIQDPFSNERGINKVMESESNRTCTSEGIVRMPTLPREIDVRVTPSQQ